MATPISVPEDVLLALGAVDHELPEDVIDPDTLMTFVHLFGFDDAEHWLREHRDCCFEALRLVRSHISRP
jgi:hypothetical protein